MNWNDSDVGYTFWDEMWNGPKEDEKGNKRGEKPRTKDTKKDDHS